MSDVTVAPGSETRDAGADRCPAGSDQRLPEADRPAVNLGHPGGVERQRSLDDFHSGGFERRRGVDGFDGVDRGEDAFADRSEFRRLPGQRTGCHGVFGCREERLGRDTSGPQAVTAGAGLFDQKGARSEPGGRFGAHDSRGPAAHDQEVNDRVLACHDGLLLSDFACRTVRAAGPVVRDCAAAAETNQKEPAIRDKYTLFAPFYDLLSGEYPVYHAGRVLGIDALAPTPGQQVLDIGCGTGLNFPLLQERIGASGTIVGIDRSAEMLRQARRRARARGWENVILIQADMVLLDPGAIAARIEASGGTAASDAALATYSLSLMGDWEQAWTNMTGLLATQAPGWVWWTCRTRWDGRGGSLRWRGWPAPWEDPTSPQPPGGPWRNGASMSSAPRPGADTCRSGPEN